MNEIILSIITPFLFAVFLLIWRKPSIGRRILAVIGVLLQVAFAFYLLHLTRTKGTLVLNVGGWVYKLGIVLSIDVLSAIMLCLGTIIVAAAIIYGFFEEEIRFEHPLRLPLIQFLMAGMAMSFCTGDLFNLFVAFEVMLISSYSILTLEVDHLGAREAFPYLAINLFGSAIFLVAAALVYALFGTLNFANIMSIAQNIPSITSDPRMVLVGYMFMVVFGIKAAMFPFFYWLPRSYPTLPTPLLALYAGMLTKVGIYAYLRIFGMVFPEGLIAPHYVVMILAAPTMLFGVIGAISKGTIRDILSWHIISQVGFMLLAFGFFGEAAFTACIIYIIHHIIVKSSLFLIGGVGKKICGTDDLNKMGGLWKAFPFLGILFLFQAMSLAGLPPLSGFWGKYLIIEIGLRTGHYILVGASIVASILTLFSMLKIWLGSFWKDLPEGEILNFSANGWKGMTFVCLLLTCLSLYIGFGAENIYEVAQHAAKVLVNKSEYIRLVMH